MQLLQNEGESPFNNCALDGKLLRSMAGKTQSGISCRGCIVFWKKEERS